jgi:FMN phosphatase YigB (HAD superfamily)
MKTNIILFDVDYTLFDTSYYRDEVSRVLKSKLPEFSDETLRKIVEDTYYEIRQHGNFSPRLFAEIFTHDKGHNLSVNEVESIWWDKTILKDALFPEVMDVLKKLQEIPNVKLGIFSTGFHTLQMEKITPLLSFFHTDDIHIFDVKDAHIEEVFNSYKNDDIVIIDDVLWILEQAKQHKASATTIWLKRGLHAEKTSIATFTPDKTITTLQELPEIISSL